jgi:hypothetical protein
MTPALCRGSRIAVPVQSAAHTLTVQALHALSALILWQPAPPRTCSSRLHPSAAHVLDTHVQGDFWDSRTSVPHHTLNAVRAALSNWRHPTVALVGNHDQSNFSGSEHGMRILEDISDAWTVVSEPAVAGGALWLPYRCARATASRLGCL